MRQLGIKSTLKQKKDVGMGVVLPAYWHPYTYVAAVVFWVFWHSHPYTLLHFWKMFSILVCVPLFHNSTLKEDIVRASFIQSLKNKSVIITAIATHHERRYGAYGGLECHHF